jgi:hypothetical protein
MQMRSSILVSFVALSFLPPLHAQTAATAPADSNTTAAPTAQAPDDATKKITELVHAGKYTEAQQLTTGLLVAYPNDQRLIKAKAVIEKLSVPAGPANAPPGSRRTAENTNAEKLTGMDKVECNVLIELTRQAQRNTDLEQQKVSLRRFMDESGAFLQKYPDQMLLWQIRAASALSLDDADAGYEAGQKLLAANAADSNDAKLQQLILQLKIKGWLEKQQVQDYKNNGWFLGTWTSSWSNDEGIHRDQGRVVFSKSEPGHIESYAFQGDGTYGNVFRGTILSPGEIGWEVYLDPALGCCPSGWQPVISCELINNKRTMKLLVPSQWANENDSRRGSRTKPNTYVLTKISDSQSP